MLIRKTACRKSLAIQNLFQYEIYLSLKQPKYIKEANRQIIEDNGCIKEILIS